ncbi:hypothetical protein P606_22310 [Comamonas thiooxydans]|jgi:hypothetical protein|nr:hypothetical protein P606_22310 [Comamonas thiooxydans]
MILLAPFGYGLRVLLAEIYQLLFLAMAPWEREPLVTRLTFRLQAAAFQLGHTESAWSKAEAEVIRLPALMVGGIASALRIHTESLPGHRLPLPDRCVAVTEQ